MTNDSTHSSSDYYANGPIQPRVWIGCLACYNAGRLVGEWFEAICAADVTPDEIHGRTTTHEELWCLDTDGLPVSREMSPAEAAEWGILLAETDEWQRDALAAWVRSGDYIVEGHGDLPSLPDFQERYLGEWDTFDDYATQLFDDLGYADELPDHLAPYLDMRAWTRDLAYDYTVTPSSNGAVHVFRNL